MKALLSLDEVAVGRGHEAQSRLRSLSVRFGGGNLYAHPRFVFFWLLFMELHPDASLRMVECAWRQFRVFAMEVSESEESARRPADGHGVVVPLDSESVDATAPQRGTSDGGILFANDQEFAPVVTQYVTVTAAESEAADCHSPSPAATGSDYDGIVDFSLTLMCEPPGL